MFVYRALPEKMLSKASFMICVISSFSEEGNTGVKTISSKTGV